MGEQSVVIEAIIRGVSAGVSLLLAGVFVTTRRLNWRRALGGLFSLATAGYVLGASEAIEPALGPALVPIRILSIYAPVIFWWFALSLFDDDFEWRLPTFIPLVLISLFAATLFLSEGRTLKIAMRVAHQAVMIAMYAHATYVALRFAPGDLIEGRRRFRVVFALAVAAAGVMIALGEIVTIYYSPSRALMLFHASSIALVTFAFALWLSSARGEVIDGRQAAATPAAEAEAAVSLSAATRPIFDRLIGLMAAGAWREEGLTVAALAEKVGVPEHQLRKLINGQLGFRNFSAFLNSYRIEAAKVALSDPAEARKQVLQIALDLGYGSIAPFNRAFKDATGQTPTEFRKARLGAS